MLGKVRTKKWIDFAIALLTCHSLSFIITIALRSPFHRLLNLIHGKNGGCGSHNIWVKCPNKNWLNWPLLIVMLLVIFCSRISNITSNSRKCMGVNGEDLQLHAVYKKPYFSLQVTQESVSGTATHVKTCIFLYSFVLCPNSPCSILSLAISISDQ